jgi:hypothetical protein
MTSSEAILSVVLSLFYQIYRGVPEATISDARVDATPPKLISALGDSAPRAPLIPVTIMIGPCCMTMRRSSLNPFDSIPSDS